MDNSTIIGHNHRVAW